MVTKGTCGRKQLKSEEGISQVPSKGHLLTFPEFSRQPPAAGDQVRRTFHSQATRVSNSSFASVSRLKARSLYVERVYRNDTYSHYTQEVWGGGKT